MRSRVVPLILALLVIGVLASMPAPAPAATAYEMYGGGTLSTTGGMPACTRFTEYGGLGDTAQTNNCNSTASNSWTFGSLPIMSKGVLHGQPQAATYNCGASTVTTTGGTDNFKVTFQFNCTKDNALMLGWPTITGQFSTPTGGDGRPLWMGFFTTAGGSTPMTCSGFFEPTGFGSNAQGPTVTSVVFEGECTSAAVSP